MEAGKTGALLSLSSVPFIMTLGNSMLIPTLPMLTKKLQVTSFQVSLIITVYSMVAIVLIPIAGYLSDCYGRKKVMIPSLIIAAIGGLISALAASFADHPYGYILAGRLLQGIGAAGAAPIVLPLVGDLFKSQSEVSSGLGMIETANTFGKVLSPILGSLLAAWVWYMPFYAIPLLCVISTILLAFLVKTPKPIPGKSTKSEQTMTFKVFWQSIKDIFHEKARWLIAVFFIGAICMYAIFSTLFYLSNLLEDTYGIDGVAKGFLLAIPLAALCLSSFLAGKVIGENKQRMKWFTFIGLVMLSSALLCCGWLYLSLVLLLLFISIAGVAIGGALPSLDAFITEGIEKEQRGTVTSLYSSMRFIGVAAGPPVASIFMNSSVDWLFYSTAIAGGLAALWSFAAIKPANKQKAAAH